MFFKYFFIRMLNESRLRTINPKHLKKQQNPHDEERKHPLPCHLIYSVISSRFSHPIKRSVAHFYLIKVECKNNKYQRCDKVFSRKTTFNQKIKVL